MKQIFILAVAGCLLMMNVNGSAQTSKLTYAKELQSVDRNGHAFTSGARTTTVGDTIMLSNITTSDTLTLYAADSGGYVTGTDYWNDLGFAEFYNFNQYDSSVVVLGVFAEFGGTVNPASSKIVTFGLWSQGVPNVVTSTISYSGVPGTLIDTVDAPITQLGIGATTDTLKEFLFATAAVQAGPFFVGYTINYNYAALDGDTIGLASSKNGERTGADYTASTVLTVLGTTATDTIINVQNATMKSDNNWYDNYTQNDSLYNDLAIFPIVAINAALLTSGVKGITRNNLTFFGNYPNPAVNSTNIQFSLAASADVTIQLMDMNGHIINTMQEPALATGSHLIPVNTANLCSGNYLYLIRTSGGDGIAGKMTVIH